jgi:CHAT domain-containing protein/tetratricopeptide (TPR) repeat protein
MTPALLIMARVGLAGGLTMPFAQAQEAAPASVPRLTEGFVLEREAAVGETHRYSMELRAGQYVQMLVEQRRADVSETLTSPDRAVLLEMDTICGVIGPDPVAFIAPADGVYELSLKVLDVSPHGRYEIRVEAVRAPTPLDRLRVKAVSAGAEALRLAAGEPAAGVDRLREAASIWHQLGDRRLEMWMEHGRGVLLGDELGRFEEGRDVTARALATAVDLGDEWAEARLRLQLGFYLRSLGQLDAGKEELERALLLHRAAGVETGAAQVLVALGTSALQAGEAQPGLEYLFEGLRSFQAAGTPLFEALTRSQLAIAFLRLRDPEAALEQCRLALPALVQEPSMILGRPTAERATCLTTMGTAHLQLGDVARARQALVEALAIWKTIGRLSLAVQTDVGLGDIYVAEGELAAGRQVFASALARTGDDPFLEGSVQCRLGDVELRLGNPKAARRAFEAALALAPRVGAWVEECAQAGLAGVARDTGDLAAARRHAETAVATGESVRGRLLGDQRRSALLASQQSRYELLTDVIMRQHEREPSRGHDVAAFEVSERARARSLLELLTEGQVDVRRGVDPALLAEERSLRRRLNTSAHEEAEARDAGRNERAESLGREVDTLAARLMETEANIRRVSPQYAALTQPQPLTLAEIRARVLDPETRLLQYALGEPRSYLWVASSTSLQSFALAPRAEIERAARRVHELASVPKALGGTDGQPEARETAMRELSGLLLAPAAGALQGQRLLVVAPGALQYVPFASLPWPDTADAAAAGGRSPAVLLSRFEIVSAPSASVIATLRREARVRHPADKMAAVFADPVFEASDPRVALAPGKSLGATAQVASRAADPAAPLEQALRGLRATRGSGLGRLPFSRREADAIAILVPARGALTATGFEASREAATSPRLGEYKMVHFATHGVLNARRPELSGVVLSLVDRAGRSQDGFLRLHDIYNLKLGADLVVLSGCQTALGKDLQGEGLIGLTRGFMFAGARAVVASLWQVDDESTAELMQRFYRAMLKDGRRPPDALRTAQLGMARHPRWSAPFYWAGFVLQGEWRKRIPSSRRAAAARTVRSSRKP